MANDLNTNPIYLDTFSSNVSVSLKPLIVRAISFSGTGADDKLVLKDKNGVPIVHIKVPTAKDWKSIHFPGGQRFNSMVCIVADGQYGSGAVALIYLK